MATIIATHMPRNPAATAGQLWPGIRIHGIDMDKDPWTVAAAAMPKISAATVRKAASPA